MEKRLKVLVRLAGCFMILVTMLAVGCGGSGGGAAAPAAVPQAQSGTVAQGAVQNALVFADHATTAEANRIMDASEAATSTMTDANGRFTLSSVPGYSYILVSQGGIDTSTGKNAMIMLAPGNANNITPLTTLMALNPNAGMVIGSLGVASDADLSTTITPAALLLVQSIQSIVTAATAVLDPNGNSLLISDVNNIQLGLMTAIAGAIQSQTASQLTNTTTLKSTLQATVKGALDTVVAKYPANITISLPATTTTVASGIVTPIVDAVAGVIDPAGTGVFSTTTTSPENTIITTTAATTINSATNSAASNASNVVHVTPPVCQPPSGITITGTPTTTTTAGVAYSFVPSATGTCGTAPVVLVFSITSKPLWAKFNAGTGALTGTPGPNDVATTSGIVISVSDGQRTASLPSFNLTVNLTGSTGGTGGGGF
jgi:hypothetical protein